MSNVLDAEARFSPTTEIIVAKKRVKPYFGAHGDEETPVLIPNTEVKLISGDYTATSGKLARCRIIVRPSEQGGFSLLRKKSYTIVMAEKFYNKLVRDKIPEIIKDTGETPIARVLTDEEYKIALLEKLIEEARELLESIGSLEERADVGEVLSALDEVFGWSASDITKARDTKNNRKGGFSKKLYLEKTIGA